MQQIEFVLQYLCMLITVPLVNWGPPECPVCRSSSVLLPAATLYTFIKNHKWLDALGASVGLLAQIIFPVVGFLGLELSATESEAHRNRWECFHKQTPSRNAVKVSDNKFFLLALCTKMCASSPLWTNLCGKNIRCWGGVVPAGSFRVAAGWTDVVYPMWAREQMYWFSRGLFQCTMGGWW